VETMSFRTPKNLSLFDLDAQELTVAVTKMVSARKSRASVLMMAEFARRHIERATNWGRIINLSTAGADRLPSEIAYGASKFRAGELHPKCRNRTREVWGDSKHCFAGPGADRMDYGRPGTGDLVHIPLGRIGSPEDVADVVVFLASTQARWLTGQRIYVRGGHGM
jgi:3-oxoacyl-[acyl-carrier protein] reductase